MKDFWHKLELPAFIRDSRLTAAAIIVAGLSLFGALIGFFISPLYGLAMILIFVLTVIFMAYGIYVLAELSHQFAANLSYRIKRGEQEAMIKMPMGILLYDDDHQIQWVNPYLQLYLKNTDVIGRPIHDVDPQLSLLLTEALQAKTSENQLVQWGDRQFEMTVQDDLGVVYLLDITRYAKIEQRYQAERLTIGQIFIDNYDELSQAMNDQNLSDMSSYVQKTLSDYVTHFKAYLKRIDSDHFLMLAHVQDLKRCRRTSSRFWIKFGQRPVVKISH